MVLADEAGPDRLPVDLKLSLPIGGALIHDVTGPNGETLKVAVPRRPGMAAARPGRLFCALAAHARPTLFPAPAS
jgi:putative spermidine/putrescine transport system ATP-binding protein